MVTMPLIRNKKVHATLANDGVNMVLHVHNKLIMMGLVMFNSREYDNHS
jgi:hypothetical protein